MKQVKILFALAVVLIAVATTAFTGNNNKNSNGLHNLQTDPAWEYFRFDGQPGEEDDYTKYTLVNISSPSELGCTNNGTVCVIQATRKSSNPMNPDYLLPNFDVDPVSEFPYVDGTKVNDLVEKGIQ